MARRTVQYWARLYSEQGKLLGGGFFVDRSMILTASHVLRDGDGVALPVGASVQAVAEQGSVFTAEIAHAGQELDMAVLTVPENAERIDRGCTGTFAAKSDAWFGPYSPFVRPQNPEVTPTNYPSLSGTVTSVEKEIWLSPAAVVEGLQLHEINDLGDYRGYSGSPAESGTNTTPGVFGMLVKQALSPVLDRREKEEHPPVVFAVPLDLLHEALTKTDLTHPFIDRLRAFYNSRVDSDDRIFPPGLGLN